VPLARARAATRSRERPQRFEIDAAAVPLIRERCRGKTVAEDDAARAQRRFDQFAHVLRARCVDDERLGERIDRALGIDERGTQAIAKAGPAGLARRNDVDPQSAQTRGEAREKRRLSAPLDAFDDDEPPA